MGVSAVLCVLLSILPLAVALPCLVRTPSHMIKVYLSHQLQHFSGAGVFFVEEGYDFFFFNFLRARYCRCFLRVACWREYDDAIVEIVEHIYTSTVWHNSAVVHI